MVERSNALIRWIVDEDEGEGSNPRHAHLSFDCSMNQEQRSFFLSFSRQEKRRVDARFSSSKAADRIELRNVSPSKTASASEIKGKENEEEEFEHLTSYVAPSKYITVH